MRHYFLLETLSPVIVSQSTSTQNHQSLDHIPGSSILGMLAAELYPKCADNTELTWQIFHSGELQFSPCYPLVEKSDGKLSLCLPTPASWHVEKGQDAVCDKLYQVANLVNQASPNFVRGDAQYEQCRNGFVSAKHQAAEVVHRITTRTALDEKRGAALDGSLFSYSFIEAKQQFLGFVATENQQALDEIIKVLKGKKRVGRSRSAEFGLVSITPIEVEPPKAPNNKKDSLVLWCLSDCEFLNKHGLATFTPSLDELIKDAEGEFDAKRSFIRTTSVSRFNQARSGIDSEQALVAKGSVLVYELAKPVDKAQLSLLENKGIGINRQQGLGWVMVNPDWAENTALSGDLFSAITFSKLEKQQPQAASSPFIDWVKERIELNQHLPEQTQVNCIIRDILRAYKNIRAYHNKAQSHLFADIGPTRAQWGRVREVLKKDSSEWQKELFAEPDNKLNHAVCKTANDKQGWGIEWQEGTKFTNFSSYFAEQFNKNNHSAINMQRAIELLSRYDLCVYSQLKRAYKELLREDM